MPFRYFFDHGARWGAQGRTWAYRGALGRSLAVADFDVPLDFSTNLDVPSLRSLRKDTS